MSTKVVKANGPYGQVGLELAWTLLDLAPAPQAETKARASSGAKP